MKIAKMKCSVCWTKWNKFGEFMGYRYGVIEFQKFVTFRLFEQTRCKGIVLCKKVTLYLSYVKLYLRVLLKQIKQKAAFIACVAYNLLLCLLHAIASAYKNKKNLLLAIVEQQKKLEY